MIRDFYEKLESTVKWYRQGKPVDRPIVIKPGSLIIQKDGGRLVSNWVFDFGWMKEDSIAYYDLWDYLAEKYPETIKWESQVNGWEWERI